MNPDQWYIDGCLKASPEDVALFEKWTCHLPKREDDTPYHSGAHSIKNFRHALAIAGLSSVFHVVEIGFCLGHSAEIFLRLGASHVVSIEISDRAQTMTAARAMKQKWPDQFALKNPSEKFPEYYSSCKFGLIDGDHSADAIHKDLDFMRQHRVPWVLFDDFWPHWGDTQQVMKELGITPVAILGTMALCDFR